MDGSGCAPADEADFSVEITRTGEDTATVQLRGDLDIASVAAARRALEQLDAGIRQVFLDLSHIAYCDAAGIRFLLTAPKQARTTGRDLITRRPSRSVRRVLAITGDLPTIGRAGPPTDEESPAGDQHPGLRQLSRSGLVDSVSPPAAVGASTKRV